GAVWVGTDDGICLLLPVAEHGATSFKCAQPPGRRSVSVHVLFEEHEGEILVGTDTGLYRMDTSPARVFSLISLAGKQGSEPSIWAIQRDRSGALWVGATNGVHRLDAGKPAVHLTQGDGLPSDEVFALEFDPEGHLWVGTGGGLCRIHLGENKPAITRTFTMKDGLPAVTVKVVHFGMQDTLWVGTTSGIAEA